MRKTSGWVLSLGIVACGGGAAGVPPVAPPAAEVAPAPIAAAPSPSPPPAETPAPQTASSVEPTVRTDEQKKRDGVIAAQITPVVDAFYDVDAALSHDRKHVLFRSNREGSPQVYLADPAKPTAAARAVTTGVERVLAARFTPDDKWIVVARDEGADENFQLLRVPVAGGDVTNLTPGEKLRRDAPVFPRLRPSEMVYSARANASPETRVYVQQVTGGEPRQAYVHALPSRVLDVSPEGAHALLLELRSPSECVLYRVDLDGRTATRLFPQAERKHALITAARYSGDGKRVYVATDDGAESFSVVRIEPGSGVVSGRYKEESPATAAISNLVVSPRAERVAIEVDEGNRTELRILDEGLKLAATVKGPLGTLLLGEFAHDGRSFTASVSTPDKPAEVIEVDAQTGITKPLRADPRPGLASAAKVDVSLALVPSSDGLSVPVNVYVPSSRRDKLPTIVLVHGGPTASARVGWNLFVSALTTLGYAVIQPNVRGSSGFGRSYAMADDKEKRPRAFKDLESVNAWARAQPWCDGDRLVVMGTGYGGYMTLIALTRQPALWRAGVDLAGPSDLRSLLKTTSGTLRSLLAAELGDPEKDASLLAELSPMAQVDKATAPLFVFQGQNDPRFPRAEGDAIVAAFRARHVPVEYMVAANEGHSLDRREVQIELFARVARFLEENASTPPPSR